MAAIDASGPGLERLYDEQYVALLRLAWVVCRPGDDARDLVQDVFVQAQRHWDRLSSHERPDLWLRRALVNSSRSRLRRGKAEQRAAAKYGGSLNVTMPTPSHELWSAVRRLPRRQREVVALVYGEDRTVVDAARILGCSEETARTHQRRALTRLASELGEDANDRD